MSESHERLIAEENLDRELDGCYYEICSELSRNDIKVLMELMRTELTRPISRKWAWKGLVYIPQGMLTSDEVDELIALVSESSTLSENVLATCKFRNFSVENIDSLVSACVKSEQSAFNALVSHSSTLEFHTEALEKLIDVVSSNSKLSALAIRSALPIYLTPPIIDRLIEATSEELAWSQLLLCSISHMRKPEILTRLHIDKLVAKVSTSAKHSRLTIGELKAKHYLTKDNVRKLMAAILDDTKD